MRLRSRRVPGELRTGSEEQAEVRRLYETVGCRVYETSELRRTQADPGIPDLIVFCPRRRRLWWHESKAGAGRQTDEQKRFQVISECCGLAYVLGGIGAAREHLRAIGLLL